jgi:hypothetical protein
VREREGSERRVDEEENNNSHSVFYNLNDFGV